MFTPEPPLLVLPPLDVPLELPEISWPRDERLDPRVRRTEGVAAAVGKSAARAICT